VSSPSPEGQATGRQSEDVCDVLVDCHERLRQVTALAAQLEASGTATAEAVLEVANKLHRYFTVSFALHEQDEEGSLFPRLLAQAPDVAPTLAALRAQHASQAHRVEALVDLCQQARQQPEAAASMARALAEAARAVREECKGHLATEEQQIFPAARRALSAEALGEIREEMRARRSLLPR